MSIDSLELKIIEIREDSVVLEIDGNPGIVEVGKTLAELISEEDLAAN